MNGLQKKKSRWLFEIVQIIRLEMHMDSRGATGAARAPKPDKTPITRSRAAAATPGFYFKNPGNTAVLPVFPPMAPLDRPDKSENTFGI
jgi:hypothetical protein